MFDYLTTTAAGLGCYPNYSFDIGDVDGDGRMEFARLDTAGNQLAVISLDGGTLFERRLENNGNWGTAPLRVADLDHDGRCEIIVPSGPRVMVFDGAGRPLAKTAAIGTHKDAYGISIPLLDVARTAPGHGPAIIAALAGGTVRALGANLETLWETGGFKRDFGHELHLADVDGDGFDEIAFCTADDINQPPGPANSGDLVLLDHDGSVLLRMPVADHIHDTHFDDIAMADFMGDGTSQILLEKGFLVDLAGNVLWDLSGRMEHGQWIAHAPAPDGKGRVGFISELWGGAKKSMMFTGRGQKIMDIQGFPWPALPEPDMDRLPSRCHAVRWDAQSDPEFFFAQQAHIRGEGHCNTRARHFQLEGFFMDMRGNRTGAVRFDDSRVQGWFYNGETHSKVADVDGDGRQEIVFPRQDGRVMLIRRAG